jgi:hypothetical protein
MEKYYIHGVSFLYRSPYKQEKPPNSEAPKTKVTAATVQ